MYMTIAPDGQNKNTVNYIPGSVQVPVTNLFPDTVKLQDLPPPLKFIPVQYLESSGYSSNPGTSVAVISVKLPAKILFCLSIEMAERIAATDAIALEIIASSLVAANFGMAIADKIPITTITNTNSNIVNAFFIFNPLLCYFKNPITIHTFTQ